MNRTIETEKKPSLELPKEMGFQSYEFLKGDSDLRTAGQEAFLAGIDRNPTLDYPYLDGHELESMLHKLEPVLSDSRQYDDELIGDVVYDSASYRMAEMYWLLEAERLNRLVDINPSSEEFLQSAERYQRANEQLYGAPNAELLSSVYGEVLAQAREKKLHPTAEWLYEELVDGTFVDAGGERVWVPGIGDGYEDHRLPQGVKEDLSELKDVLLEKYSHVEMMVNAYWEYLVLPRNEAVIGFTPDDMRILYEGVRDYFDPENTAGIEIVIDPDSTNIAWDTPSKSIKIGADRNKITSPSKMLAKIIHEFGVHGTRMIEGRKSGVPTLDTGMYSDANGDEQSDYLTFEEGFASLCEMAIDESFTNWKPLHMSHTIALSARYEGLDFRQAYERTWRARILMEVQDGTKVSPLKVKKAKEQAFKSCVRVMRGTPTQLIDGPLLTYNKDLAYLGGKLDALKYLAENRGNKQAILRLFLGKYDPNNQTQNSIVQKYVENS